MAEEASTRTVRARVGDTFQNFIARMGRGTGNVSDGGSYGFTFETRNRLGLEAMYRGSWIVGRVVDAVADDMTRAGAEVKLAEDDPSIQEEMDEHEQEIGLWQSLNRCIRWSRLYGGSIGIIMIKGQDYESPLDPSAVSSDQFRGVFPLDRWQVSPDILRPVTEPGPKLGLPEFYDIQQGAQAFEGARIHYSRVLRFEGLDLPWYQKQAEYGWGMSVVERMFDRLLAFDSATTGAAQLVHKAHLRIMKVKDLRNIIGQQGKQFEALLKQLETIRYTQSIEGMSVVDQNDDFETTSYSFSGLDTILAQFAEQISGAVEIPLVRMFGQSPSGFSTGDSDLENYYDGISSKQNAQLKQDVRRLKRLLYMSTTGQPPPPGFQIQFRPLYTLRPDARATMASTITTAVDGAVSSGLVSRATGLKELRRWSSETGLWSNVTDEEIKEAEAEPAPSAQEALGGETQPGEDGPQGPGASDEADDGPGAEDSDEDTNAGSSDGQSE